MARNLRVRSFLTVCIGSNPCRPSATYVYGGIRREVYVEIRQGRFAQIVWAKGSQSSGSSGGLSTELATSEKARDSTDSAIAIMVSRT
jgi:hypothetical protein